MRTRLSMYVPLVVVCLLSGCAVRVVRMGAASDTPIVHVKAPGFEIIVRPIEIEFKPYEEENESEDHQNDPTD